MEAGRPAEAASLGGSSSGSSSSGSAGKRRARLPREARMHKRAEYLEVQSRGRRVQAPHFILLVLTGARPAFGITITRKVAGAVGRNRVKRLCREVYRLNRELFPADCAVVAVARAGADGLDYAAVQAEIAGASAGLFRAAGSSPAAGAPRTADPKPR